MSQEAAEHPPSSPASPLAGARAVLEAEAEALARAAARLGPEIIQAADIIAGSAAKVVVSGIGKSGIVGQKIAATLSSTGSPAVFLHAAEAIHGDLGIYQPGDPTLLVSKSGCTADLLRFIPTLKDLGSPMIALVGQTRSPIAREADVVLDGSVPREADPLAMVPTSSATVAMAIGDALASVLMVRRGFRAQDYARFHPGGQLGRNLLMRVRDAMHPTAQIATVQAGTSLRETIIAMTDRPLGAACVLGERGELTGIITDGDVRRFLRDRENLAGLDARALMTPDPVAITPAAMLADAVRLMEDRPRQISVLPVIADGPSRTCLGLLRIHDIYRPGNA